MLLNFAVNYAETTRALFTFTTATTKRDLSRGNTKTKRSSVSVSNATAKPGNSKKTCTFKLQQCRKNLLEFFPILFEDSAIFKFHSRPVLHVRFWNLLNLSQSNQSNGMPNRIIREGILTSERVNRLAPQAELFYRRLMSVVDDFGRFTAHPGLLRSACYPLRVDEVREADISRWLAEVQLAGLIALYAVAGKGYLEMIDFRQQVRAKVSKFPAPDDEQLRISCVAVATQLRASAHLDGDGDGDGDGMKLSTVSCTEPPLADSVPEVAVLKFPCVGQDGGEWTLTEKKLAEYCESFPGIDVLIECRKARQWCIDNKTHRKTKKGMPRFLTGWLSKSQNSSRNQINPAPPASRNPTDAERQNWNPTDAGLE